MPPAERSAMSQVSAPLVSCVPEATFAPSSTRHQLDYLARNRRNAGDEVMLAHITTTRSQP